MRIRRRERLFLALKGYGTFMYTSNHTFLLPSKRRQKQLWGGHIASCLSAVIYESNYACSRFSSDQLKSEIFFSPSFSFSLALTDLTLPLVLRPPTVSLRPHRPDSRASSRKIPSSAAEFLCDSEALRRALRVSWHELLGFINDTLQKNKGKQMRFKQSLLRVFGFDAKL